MILAGKKLVNTLREKCDNAKKRIWIASPFIGKLEGVQQVIGGSWKQSTIDFKVITDIETGFIKEDTFNEFMLSKCQLRTLKSLHAKIYIIDDWVLLTSANLTGTAFSKRYEVGTEITNSEGLLKAEVIFNGLYKLANDVKSHSINKSHNIQDYQDGNKYKTLWKLPSYTLQNKVNNKYFANVAMYRDFSLFYENTVGRNKQMETDGFTLYQEIDYLFNFLYHVHHDTPSNKYQTTNNLMLSEKKKLLKKHFVEMKKYYLSDNKKLERVERVKIVQNAINKSGKLKWTDVKDISNCFHCYGSYPLNRHRLLNQVNNNINDIDKYWKSLLFNICDKTIIDAKTNIIGFGDSSLQELIGWYDPHNYPIMNTNSHCGMRYFGYNIF